MKIQYLDIKPHPVIPFNLPFNIYHYSIYIYIYTIYTSHTGRYPVYMVYRRALCDARTLKPQIIKERDESYPVE